MQQDEMQKGTLPTPAMNTMPEYMPEKKGMHLGPTMAIVIVLAALVLGGVYLWESTLPDETADENVAPMHRTGHNAAAASDALNVIEKDLNASTPSATDDFAAIDAALKP